MVSTLDFESSDPSSNLGGTCWFDIKFFISIYYSCNRLFCFPKKSCSCINDVKTWWVLTMKQTLISFKRNYLIGNSHRFLLLFPAYQLMQLKYILLTVVAILVSFSFFLCRVSYQAYSRGRGGKGGENRKFITKWTSTTRRSLVGSGR